ncbi:unnamed protein product [Scytosiphon promiscuus]
MRAALQVLTLLLSAHAAFGKAQVRLVALRHENHHENAGSTSGFADKLQDTITAVGDAEAPLAVEPVGYNAAGYGGRELQSATSFFAILLIVGIPCEGEIEIEATIKISVGGKEDDVEVVVPVAPDPSTPGYGGGKVEVPLTEEELNDEKTDVSPDCVITVDPHECIAGDCDHYTPDEKPDEPDVIDVTTTSDNLPTSSDTDALVGDPHMLGLRGQKIDWSGEDGGWYSLVQDSKADFSVNVRLTAPLPAEFPDRQLVTGLSVMAEGHSLAIEVKNPYTVNTDGCPQGVSPCLANGGLRAVADGTEVDDLLRFSRAERVAGDLISMSASNLPVECRQFGGDKIWARMFNAMMQSRRLRAEEQLEDWILRYPKMAAPDWCAKYIAENNLADLQSTHAIFKIETPAVTVRLNAGVNFQGDGEMDANGVVLPDLDFWQMDVGFDGLDVDNPELSGILGETARPVYNQAGEQIMGGFEAFRGDVESYRVSGPLGTHFSLLDHKKDGHE